MTPVQEQVLALAAVAQAAQQVHRIATTGQSDAAATQPLIDSLFMFDAPDTESIYGGVRGVKPGLMVLGDVLGGQNPVMMEPVMRYMLSTVQIAGMLRREPQMLETIHNRLEHAQRHRQHFPDQPESLAHNIAAIYQDTVSTLRFRIKVTGSVEQLQNSANAELIRTLLLAGIRAAWLWHQVGGRRWHWLLRRPRLAATAMDLLRGA